MSDEELKRLYVTTNKFWKLIKGGSHEAAFCMDMAAFLYRLMTEDPKTDAYWDMACKASTKLYDKYSTKDYRCFQGQMIMHTLDAASEISVGKYRYAQTA